MGDQRRDPVDRLLQLLTVSPVGDDRFEVPNPDRGFGPRVFGGQVAAQALVAATATMGDDRRAHSLHAYFLRPGRPGVPIIYDVERTRDGRSFSTRRVVARQPGEHADEAIFEMSTSFHVDEPGIDYAQPINPRVPAPADAGDDMGFIPPGAAGEVPFELKELGAEAPGADGYFPSTRRVWMRIKSGVPDDPGVHTALLTFMSDMGAVMGARPPLDELDLRTLMGASLDHSLFFHRPIRADEWVLYDLRAVSTGGGRGLTMGTMHAADGTLGMSVTQEAMLRVVDPARATIPPEG